MVGLTPSLSLVIALRGSPSPPCIIQKCEKMALSKQPTEKGNAMNAATLEHATGTPVVLRHDQIVPAPWGNVRVSPRTPESKAELIESARLHGILQSVVVRPHPTQPDMFELLAGYGRYDAAVVVGCPIPAIVKNVTDAEGVAIGMMENIIRENMSPVDESKAAKLTLSFCNGDYEEARLRLGWTMPHLKQRLHLTRCIPAVLDALSGGEAKLTLRHADLLAGVSEEAQQALLAEILKKNMSVEDLKVLLGKATRALSKARFDIAECAGCEHNTLQQNSLFDEFKTGDGAHCRNLVCFKAKTAEMISQQRDELTERYGTIILLSEADRSIVRNIDHDAVGAEQFFNGCMSCSHRVALLDDRLDTAGDVQENFCTKLDCYTNCVSTKKAAEAQELLAAEKAEKKTKTQKGKQVSPEKTNGQPVTASGDTNATSSGAAASTTASGNGAEHVQCKLTTRVIDDNKVMLRQAAVDAWGATSEAAQTFQLAVVLSAIKSLTGSPFATQLPRVLESMSIDDMRNGIVKAVKSLVDEAKTVGCWNMTDILISTLQHAPDAKTHAVANWIPTTERLDFYTKDALIVLLKQSGFKDAYQAAQGEKALRKLLTQSKGDLIKGVIEFPFDWSSFAPGSYLNKL